MGLSHFCMQEKRAEGETIKLDHWEPFLCSYQKFDPIHQVVTRQRDRLYSQVARTMSSKYTEQILIRKKTACMSEVILLNPRLPQMLVREKGRTASFEIETSQRDD